MAKLRFGTWIPTYAWSDAPATPDSVREHTAKIRDSILKCEEHGIDVWVIDHLLSAPGLYGNAWLEPLNVLAYASALTSKTFVPSSSSPGFKSRLAAATASSISCGGRISC